MLDVDLGKEKMGKEVCQGWFHENRFCNAVWMYSCCSSFERPNTSCSSGRRMNTHFSQIGAWIQLLVGLRQCSAHVVSIVSAMSGQFDLSSRGLVVQLILVYFVRALISIRSLFVGR